MIRQRVFTAMATILAIGVITFLVFQILPGDAAQLILGTEADPEVLATLREQLGLNMPLGQRLWHWVTSVIRGDLGVSLSFNLPVNRLVLTNIGLTIGLSLYSMLLAVVIGLPLGIMAAVKNRKSIDYIILVVSQIGLAIPSFWMGLILILVFAIFLQVFNIGQYVMWRESIGGALRALTLPALALALPRAAVIVRITRSSMLDVLKKDYIRTAHSKGLRESTVVYRHALKNALIPITTIIGLQLTELMAGAIIVEQVFALPGLGSLLLRAVGRRDLPLLQGIALSIAVGVVLVNLLTDIIYTRLDPRLREGESG